MCVCVCGCTHMCVSEMMFFEELPAFLSSFLSPVLPSSPEQLQGADKGPEESKARLDGHPWEQGRGDRKE